MTYGVRDVIALLPPILVAQWSITSPAAQTIEAARILGSNDPTYGTIGWLPSLDGVPFALLNLVETKEAQIEANRIQTTATIEAFLVIEHAEVPTVYENFHDLCVAYIDSLRQLIAANYYLQPGASGMETDIGDIRWRLQSTKLVPSKVLLGSAWFGASCLMTLQCSIPVNYQ